jgi:hypothetical protein
LVSSNGGLLIKVFHKLRTFCIADGLLSCSPQRVSKLLIQIQGHHRLGQVVEISSEYVGGIVNSVTIPDESFSVPIRRIEQSLELFDALFGATQTKNTFRAGS